MAKDQKSFFHEKKPWSQVKDDLLACYLKPYFQKVLTTGQPVRYIDCFAGRGDFDDGSLGSPLIALSIARHCVQQSRSPNTDICMYFIEAILGSDLERVLATRGQAQSSMIDYMVVKGRFQQQARPLITKLAGSNVFIYVDPYGIKDLDFNLISGFGHPGRKLNSVEILINFNSFGFVRAGCAALKVQCKNEAAEDDDTGEFDTMEDISVDLPGGELADRLNAVAGGDYWQAVVQRYSNGELNWYDAEQQFADLYCKKLAETYKYALSMPIRLAAGRPPKYRMVYATNHPVGCILMADNMMLRTDNLYIHLPAHAQGSLFDQDVEGGVTDPSDILAQVHAVTEGLSDYTDVDQVIASVYVRAGVVCKSNVIRDALKQMENDGTIEVSRLPEHTDAGKPTAFFNTGHGHKVKVRQAGRGTACPS